MTTTYTICAGCQSLDTTAGLRMLCGCQCHDEENARRAKVWDAIRPIPNWKTAVNAVVLTTFATPEEIIDAVAFFTGSAAEIHDTTVPIRPHPDALVLMEVPAYHVTAAGYYVAIGS